jgi:hypothetical protein
MLKNYFVVVVDDDFVFVKVDVVVVDDAGVVVVVVVERKNTFCCSIDFCNVYTFVRKEKLNRRSIKIVKFILIEKLILQEKGLRKELTST